MYEKLKKLLFPCLFDGLLLGAPADHVVVKLAPAPVPCRVDEYYVVASVVIPAEIGNSFKICLY